MVIDPQRNHNFVKDNKNLSHRSRDDDNGENKGTDIDADRSAALALFRILSSRLHSLSQNFCADLYKVFIRVISQRRRALTLRM